MIEVVGVRFKAAGKIYFFSPGDIKLEAMDKVIVETARGIEFGELVIPPREIDEEQAVLPLKQVIRKAGKEDELILEQNKNKEKEAFQICLKKIAEHNLPMKLVDVEYTFDGNKIIFSFTAEGRVDFRELVKDLAAVFRTRIELRQIGVRDEAKMLGGIGSCGRVLCCASFLGDFEPVSIRMAKDQKLSLNPTKISGICGRLMCCLKYENGSYGSDEGIAAKLNLPEYTEDADLAEIEEETPDEPRGPANATPVFKPKGKGQAGNGQGSNGAEKKHTRFAQGREDTQTGPKLKNKKGEKPKGKSEKA